MVVDTILETTILTLQRTDEALVVGKNITELMVRNGNDLNLHIDGVMHLKD